MVMDVLFTILMRSLVKIRIADLMKISTVDGRVVTAYCRRGKFY
jgi:hypothetical protein